jgi:hypothetical protein
MLIVIPAKFTRHLSAIRWADSCGGAESKIDMGVTKFCRPPNTPLNHYKLTLKNRFSKNSCSLFIFSPIAFILYFKFLVSHL